MVGHEHPAPMEKQSVGEAPWLVQLTRGKLLPQELGIWRCRGSLTDEVEEGEGGP